MTDCETLQSTIKVEYYLICISFFSSLKINIRNRNYRIIRNNLISITVTETDIIFYQYPYPNPKLYIHNITGINIAQGTECIAGTSKSTNEHYVFKSKSVGKNDIQSENVEESNNQPQPSYSGHDDISDISEAELRNYLPFDENHSLLAVYQNPQLIEENVQPVRSDNLNSVNELGSAVSTTQLKHDLPMEATKPEVKESIQASSSNSQNQPSASVGDYSDHSEQQLRDRKLSPKQEKGLQLLAEKVRNFMRFQEPYAKTSFSLSSLQLPIKTGLTKSDRF